ncbi:MAG: UDP-4-amino-4,6-dideoxy-N-acetyl-beta-L-altrosamine transaminase [Hyphomicrobiaceae bacterium]|nr:UDP-4-amino-4,6-dideoxy-N-acetyl-beta-L-altrosamine transaminase [Hyphomicrobiaceae bacterium]
MTRPIIPYGRQSIDEDDIRAVADVLRGDYLTTGPAVAAFEEAFAARVGAKYAVACSNGTAALHLAAMAIGLGAGDTAVVPTLTFLATANGPHYTGADVVFADADPTTALMTPETIRAALDRAGPNVRALFVVHMNGQCCDMEAIGRIARERGITLIEDACHAVGTRYKTASGAWHEIGACAHADMACFSLHPVKTLTMGEGGVVTTNDPEKYERMCRLRSHGMVREPDLYQNRDLAFAASGQPNPWYYEMPEVGYNYRATDMQCALGSSQLRKLDGFIARRKELAAAYDRHFAGRNGNFTAFGRHAYCDPALHLYVLLIDFEAVGKDRAQVMRELLDRRVGTQVHYLPVHRQPYYVSRYGAQSLPGADAYYARALSIPLFPAMTEADVAHVVESIEAVLAQN